MEVDDPLSIAISELYCDLSLNYDNQFKSNCSTVTITTTTPTDHQVPAEETMATLNVDYCGSDQFVVPSWSDIHFNYDQNDDSSSFIDPNSSFSSNSFDQSISSPISSTILSYNHSMDLSPDPPSQDNKSLSMETEFTQSPIPLSSSNDHPLTLKDKQLNRDIELLQLFESSVFNTLLEDNFIKINLQNEALAVESGLRQLELNKYHELAKVVDLFYENRNVSINIDQQTDRFQIAIIHKHTEKLIKTVKKITSFNNLCLDDQISLLKSRFIDLIIIKSLVFIEPETREIKINGQRISMEKCHMMNNEKFIQLTAAINPILRSDPIINLLILLICLLNPKVTSLRSTFSVRKEYILTIHLVQKYLEFRGFTINQANYEIKNLICNLENFLFIFNGKQKIQDIARKHLGYTSQLIAEMLDINGQHDQKQPP